MATTEIRSATLALDTINAHQLPNDRLSGEELDVPVLIVGGGANWPADRIHVS